LSWPAGRLQRGRPLRFRQAAEQHARGAACVRGLGIFRLPAGRRAVRRRLSERAGELDDQLAAKARVLRAFGASDRHSLTVMHARPYSLRTRKKARTYPSASLTSKPHSPSSMKDNSFTNDTARWRKTSKSASGSRVYM